MLTEVGEFKVITGKALEGWEGCEISVYFKGDTSAIYERAFPSQHSPQAIHEALVDYLKEHGEELSAGYRNKEITRWDFGREMEMMPRRRRPSSSCKVCCFHDDDGAYHMLFPKAGIQETNEIFYVYKGFRQNAHEKPFMRGYFMPQWEEGKSEDALFFDKALYACFNDFASITSMPISRKTAESIREGKPHIHYGEFRAGSFQGKTGVDTRLLAELMNSKARDSERWSTVGGFILGKEGMAHLIPGPEAEQAIDKMLGKYLPTRETPAGKSDF